MTISARGSVKRPYVTEERAYVRLGVPPAAPAKDGHFALEASHPNYFLLYCSRSSWRRVVGFALRRAPGARRLVVSNRVDLERPEPTVEREIGPVKVPKAASDVAQPGWSINIVLGRANEMWHVVEVGNAYP